MSMRAPEAAGRADGTMRSAKIYTATPTGMFTMKMACQLKTLVRIPPRSTPTLPPPAEEEESAEEEHVRVHDPGERALGEAEVRSDRWQRDVHDGRVEHDHEAAQAEDHESAPAGTILNGDLRGGHCFVVTAPSRRVCHCTGPRL